MGSEKSSESTSYSGSGQLWARPFAKRGVNAVFGAYDSAQPTLNRAVGGTSTIADQLQAKFGVGQQTAGQAQDYWSKILSGGYLNSNPDLDKVIGRATTDARDAVNSNYNGAGRYGSGMHDAAVARETGNISSQLRYGDYNNQMSRMDQAAQAAQASNSGDAGQALGAFGQQGQLPYTGMSSLSQSLAALFNGGNSHSVSYAPNPIWGAVGAGLGAAGSYFGAGGTLSSGKAKNIIRVTHVDPDGLQWVDFTYKNDPDKQVLNGVIAEQVKDLRPQAYIPDFKDGMPGVNYAAL